MNIVFIAGMPGAGKSFVARKVAQMFLEMTGTLTELIGTDSLREILRQNDIYKNEPTLHVTSSETGQFAPPEVKDKNIWGLQRQAEIVVAGGVSGVLRRCISNNKNVVMEGIHLIPSIIQQNLFHHIEECRSNNEVHLVTAVITVDNVTQHILQLQEQNRASTTQKLANIDKIREMQDYLLSETQQAHNCIVIENTRNTRQIAEQIITRCLADNYFVRNKNNPIGGQIR